MKKTATVKLSTKILHVINDAYDVYERDGYLDVRDEDGGTLAVYAPGTWEWATWGDLASPGVPE